MQTEPHIRVLYMLRDVHVLSCAHQGTLHTLTPGVESRTSYWSWAPHDAPGAFHFTKWALKVHDSQALTFARSRSLSPSPTRCRPFISTHLRQDEARKVNAMFLWYMLMDGGADELQRKVKLELDHSFCMDIRVLFLASIVLTHVYLV